MSALANVVGPDETSFCVSWSERQIDEIPDRYDPGIAEVLQTEQVFVFADDEVRFGCRRAFEYAVVVGIFLMTCRLSVGDT